MPQVAAFTARHPGCQVKLRLGAQMDPAIRLGGLTDLILQASRFRPTTVAVSVEMLRALTRGKDPA